LELPVLKHLSLVEWSISLDGSRFGSKISGTSQLVKAHDQRATASLFVQPDAGTVKAAMLKRPLSFV
jgi:hypothetical protein